MFFKLNNYKTLSLGKVYHDAKQDKDAWDFFYDIPTEKNNYHNWESYASQKNNVKRYLYTSTYGVYGKSLKMKEENVWKTFPSEHLTQPLDLSLIHI